MRCLAALARWEELNNLCKEQWTAAEPAARLEMAPMVWDLIHYHNQQNKHYFARA